MFMSFSPRGAIAAKAAHLLARDDGQLFLGEDFFPWIILAFGAAMVVGNLLALLRPPAGTPRGDPAEGGIDDTAAPGDPQRPPVGRALVLMVVGLAAAVWGLASLLGN